MIAEREVRIEIGGYSFAAPFLGQWYARQDIGGNSEFAIDVSLDAPGIRLINLHEALVVFLGEECYFVGDIESASPIEGRLHLRAKAGVRLSETGGAATTTLSGIHFARCIFLDSGFHLPDEDDDNGLCRATSSAVDWDSLSRALQDSLDLEHAARILESFCPPDDAHPNERHDFEQIVQLLRAITQVEDSNTDGKAHLRLAHFADCLAWRYRREQDQWLVVIPVRGLELTKEVSPRLLGISFTASCPEHPALQSALQVRTVVDSIGWKAKTYASAIVSAFDAWTAKEKVVGDLVLAQSVLTLGLGSGVWSVKLDGKHLDTGFVRNGASPPIWDGAFCVVSLRTNEYWLGSAPEPLGEGSLDCSWAGGWRADVGVLLAQAAGDTESEFCRHLRRSLTRYYQARLAATRVDEFLFYWISLENLLKRESEKKSSMYKRAPYLIAEPGEKTGRYKRRVEKWGHVRDEIVHRALLDYENLDIGTAVIRHASEAALIHAAARKATTATLDEWLTYLDGQAAKRPLGDAKHAHPPSAPLE